MTKPEVSRYPLLAWFALASGLAVASLVSPLQASAQCSGCTWTGRGNECGLMGAEPRCQGSYDGWCEPCPWFAEAPLAPDGSIHIPRLGTPGDLWAKGSELTTGVAVVRSACSGIITERYFTDEAAAKARASTARLTFG
jgi:hypothetical protein